VAEVARPTLRAAAWIAGLWLTAHVFLALDEPLRHSPIAYDEEFFAWGGWSINKGFVPYKDFVEFKPPILFLTHALAQKLFGLQDLAFRRFFTIFPLASLLLFQASLLWRKIDATLVTALMVGFVALFVNPAFHDRALADSESIGLSYFVLGLGFLLAQTKYRSVTDAIGAAFMACAVFSKEPFAPAVVATWASAFLLRGGAADLRRSAVRYVKFTGLGVAVVLLGLCIYMVPTGSMRAYLQMVGSYARIHRDPKLSYCVALGLFHPSTPMHEFEVQWEGMRQQFLNFAVLGYLIPLFAAACVYIPRRSLLLLVATGAGLVGGLWAVTSTNCQWPHYYTMTMSGVVAFLAIGLDAMKGSFWAADRTMRAFVRVAVAGTIAATVYPRYAAGAQLVHAGPFAQEPIPGIFEFVASHSAPTDRIFTTGPPMLYVYTDRRNAAREGTIIDEILGSYPGTTDEEKLRPIREELVQNMPKIVVLDPERAERKRRHMNALVTPFLTDFHYRREGEYVYVRP
jgi:hypothetical protein